MLIGIDIRSLQNDSQNRGIGMYTRCLIKNMLPLDKSNDYVFFVYKNKPLPTLLKEKPFEKIKIRKVTSRKKYLDWVLGQLLFPQAIAEEKLDIFHSPEYMLPPFSLSKKIITVHDFIHSDYGIYRKRNNFIRTTFLHLRDAALKSADKIIADSGYTKKKIIQLLGISQEKIKVVYLAADSAFVPRNDENLDSQIKNKYGIKNDFLLYVGVFDQHKNIHGFIKAFKEIRLRDIALVLVGANTDGRYFTFIHALIEELEIEDRVHILGYVPQEDLVSLYNMAKIVISVSFYEGFGLPILEAMACGRPVIASGNTSMREIVDSAGILVNPCSLEEITYAIDNLLSDEDLRNLLSQKALIRTREFSWEKTARETLLLYEDLLR